MANLSDVKLTSEYGAKENPEFKDSDGWTCTIKYQGRQYTFEYYKGLGHHGAEPEIKEVMSCLFLDTSGFDSSRDFEDWCGQYGYDTDSRKAERIYKAVEKQAKAVHRVFDEDYNAFAEMASEF